MDAEKLHLALAEKAAEQAKVRYDGGLITSLDLLNVQADLSRSRSLYSRAIYEFILARAALNKAAGLPQPAGNGGSL
jgi:outer membrane protein TolC